MSGGYNSPGAAAVTSVSSDTVNSFDRDEGGLGSIPIIGIDYKKCSHMPNSCLLFITRGSCGNACIFLH